MAFEIREEVCLKPGATYVDGKPVVKSLVNKKLYIRGITEKGDYVISLVPRGGTNGIVKQEFVVKYEESLTLPDLFFAVALIDADVKNKPGIVYKTIKTLTKDVVYTILEEKDGWGRLKIGGWVSLDEVRKIEKH